jgi:hypothetical protein
MPRLAAVSAGAFAPGWSGGWNQSWAGAGAGAGVGSVMAVGGLETRRVPAMATATAKARLRRSIGRRLGSTPARQSMLRRCGALSEEQASGLLSEPRLLERWLRLDSERVVA